MTPLPIPPAIQAFRSELSSMAARVERLRQETVQTVAATRDAIRQTQELIDRLKHDTDPTPSEPRTERSKAQRSGAE